MPWARQSRSHCYSCGRERQEGERFSARGKCVDCGNRNQLDEKAQLRAHSGPYFDEWRRAHAAAVGAVLLDDLQRKR